MKNLIIGTAGHVDHGKTVLVERLTGINTDRLKEEKDRGISIELGFTSLILENGQEAGIIDVPGHERFIKNMLAGVGGIDMVLLTISADEGVMPQTREHMDIIQLLQIDMGIIVITKIDLVDEEFLELVREDVQDFISQTVLSGAPICEVSSVTGEGIDQLKRTITEMAGRVPYRSQAGVPRLPIDRVFSITGFGTVVTGTLVSGCLQVGDHVEIFPPGIPSRVRSLQVHGVKQDQGRAGQRVAANLAGIEKASIRRGQVLAAPGSLQPWNRVDVRLHLLRSAPRPVQNRSRVRVYLGTEEILSRVILLDRDEIRPGDDCYAQLMMEGLVACARDDRFVIRSYSPMLTIGGGKVIDPVARKLKRFKPEVIDALRVREKGSPVELTEQFLNTHASLYSRREIKPLAGLEQTKVEEILTKLAEKNTIKLIDADPLLYAGQAVYKQWVEQITSLVENYHRQYPLRAGYPKEEIRSRLFSRLASKQFQQLLQAMENDHYLELSSQSLAKPSFKPAPNQKQARVIKEIETVYQKAKYQPPNWSDVVSRLKPNGEQATDQLSKEQFKEQFNEILQYLLRQKILVKVADSIFFHQDTIKDAQWQIKDYFKNNDEISIGAARDIFKTSRKYTLPLLEYLDSIKITRRVGDMRVAGKEGLMI